MADPPAKPPDPLDINSLNTLLDIIRTNLSNVERTWGASSPQLAAARGVYQQALAENLRRMGVGLPTEGVGVEELIRGMEGMGLGGEPTKGTGR